MALPRGDCRVHGHALGTNRQSIRRIFHVRAGEIEPRRQNRGADREVRIAGIRVSPGLERCGD